MSFGGLRRVTRAIGGVLVGVAHPRTGLVASVVDPLAGIAGLLSCVGTRLIRETAVVLAACLWVSGVSVAAVLNCLDRLVHGPALSLQLVEALERLLRGLAAMAMTGASTACIGVLAALLVPVGTAGDSQMNGGGHIRPAQGG